MDKIFSVAAVMAVSMLSSCGGNMGGKVAEEDSLSIDTVATLEETDSVTDIQTVLTDKLQDNDAVQMSSAIEQAVQEAQKALESGNQETAQKYASQIKAFVDANATKLKELDVNTVTVDGLLEAVKNLPTNAEQTAQNGKAAVKSDAAAAKQVASEVTEKVQADVKSATGKAVEDAKGKASEKVDEVVNKANEKADEVIQNAATKAKKNLGL